jgi:hypothetical protein
MVTSSVTTIVTATSYNIKSTVWWELQTISPHINLTMKGIDMALSIDPKGLKGKLHTLNNNERQILEYLRRYRNPYKPLDVDALNVLNDQHLSIGEMDWVFTVQALQEKGCIHNVEVKRNADVIPYDYVKFSPESYITYIGIVYMYEYEWPKPDESEKLILDFLLKYRNPDKYIDNTALHDLNHTCLSMDEMDWVYIVTNLCKSNYIKNVRIGPGNSINPYGTIEFSKESYITHEGIRYLKGIR